MDDAELAAITDVETLRALVREQMAVIADKSAAMAQRDQVIRQHDQVIRQREQTIHQHERTIQARDLKIAKLTHEMARLKRVHYSAKTEAMSAVQRDLFDAAMAADMAALEAELEALHDTSPSTPRRRRKPARRTLPNDLPRVETTHEPGHDHCRDCGHALIKIGEHISEKLDVKPLEFFVRRDIYPQYACRTCETITAEPVAPAILDRGLAAPGLLAQVAIQKYADHLPLYRQEAIFARHGITLKRTTLAEWIGVIGLRLQPLVDALHTKLLRAPVLHADETPVRQLDPGKGKTKQAYLFAYRNTDTEHPVIVFDYRPGRGGQYAAAFLHGWHGALMVDGYAGYDRLFAKGVTALACWAHARRTFYDVWKANDSPIAKEAIERIAVLYQIEAKLRDLTDAERGRYRRDQSAPHLEQLKIWLDDIATKALPGSALSKAIAYTRKRWDALTRYAHNGAWPIDNNPAERAIRPIAIGRKNWLFAGSETAGQRAAAIMSLIATAKANGIDPHAWLTDVLTRLPTTKDRDIDSLLPLA